MISQTLPLHGKRVAFFHQSSDLYGSDRVLLDLAEAVQQNGGEAVVLLPDEGLLTNECRARGIECHAVDVLKVSRATFSPRGLWRLAKGWRRSLAAFDGVLGDRRVDLVHSNTIAVLGGALWARKRRIPHLWHVHEIIERPALAAWTFPLLVRLLSDRVVCNSHATCRWLLAAQPKLVAMTDVVWNGVRAPAEPADTDTRLNELHSAFRPDGARLAVGLVGRINRWKGQQFLMDAMDTLHARGVRDVSVVFVGSPPPGQDHFLADLHRRIAASPLRGMVVVRKFTQEVWPAFTALDIVCVPSTEPEPFGLVAIEAMAMSRPVVASNFGGLTEIVVDGLTGRLFKPGDAHLLADALKGLLDDETSRWSMGQAGRQRFEDKFSVLRMVERFTAIYLDAMAAQR